MMTPAPADEIRNQMRTTIERAMAEQWDGGRISAEFHELLDGYDVVDTLYVPDEALVRHIEDYIDWREGRKKIGDPGQLLEQIAYLAFTCLDGYDSVKNYTSYSQQHDLVISGTKTSWEVLIKHLLPENKQSRTIVVEAKNLRTRVSDAQFSRLCSILQNKFQNQCMLGVFITRSGASGFPSKTARRAQRSLRDARATQILFHARTGKYVVVLDDQDIRNLTQKGALPRMLEQKIRDVEEATGLAKFATDEEIQEIVIPSHLATCRTTTVSSDKTL